MATSPMQEVKQLGNQQAVDIQGLIKQLGDSTATIQGLMAGNAESNAQRTAAITAATEASVASAVKKQDLVTRHQTIANMDPDSLTNEFQQTFNVLNRAKAQYDTDRAEYDKMTSVGLLDDPIGYIFNQLALPQVAARVNNSSDAIQAATANLASRQQLLAAQNSTVLANTIDEDAKAARARAAIDVANANEAASRVQVGNLQAIAQLSSAAISATNTTYDNKIKALQIQIQASEAASNRALRARQIADMDEMKAQRLADMRKKAEADNTYRTRLLTVGKTLGYQVDLTPEVFEQLSPKTQAAISGLALQGNFGSTLGDAVTTISNLPGKEVLGASNAGMKNFLRHVDQYTASRVGQLSKGVAGTPNYVPPKDREAFAVQELETAISQSTSNPNSASISSSSVWDSTPNPTLINPRLMATVPMPGNSLHAAMKTALELKGPDKDLSKADEQLAYSAVRQRVLNKEITVDQAVADITAYAKAGVAKSAEATNYPMMGIEVPKAYYTEWKAEGVFGKKIKVNLLNPASVKNAFIKDVRGFAAFDEATGGPFQLTR